MSDWFGSLRESSAFSSFATSWLGGSHGRAVSVARDALEAVDFWLGGELQIQPQILRLRFLSFLLTNLCIVALQLEYTKKQGTENLHFAAIFKLRYIKKQDTKHLDSAIIFEVLAIILLLHTCWHKCLTDFLIIEPSYQAACKSLGLLGDDKEWIEALANAVNTATCPQLRQLFVTIILFCDTDAIQASVKEIDYDFVAPKIKAGSIYEITHFYTGRNKPSHKIVPHVAQLCFGHITAIQPLEQKMVGNERLEDKCEVCIENIRKEDVRITLWGNTAKTFDAQALQQSTSPIFAAFTSLKVKQFQGKIVLNSSVSTLIFINPDIQELAAYKTIFSDSTHAVKMMPSSTTQLMTPQYLEAAKKLSVQELNVLDPETHKDTPILCRAAITRFDIRNGWWYKACPSCFKQLRSAAHRDELLFKVCLVLEDSTDETNAIIIGRAAEQLFKISCNELVVQRGFTDQQLLPDVILQTRGQVKIFQLRFGSMRSDFNRNDLLIQAVFDDTIPLIEPTPQSPDQSLAAHDTETIGAQMIPPITPAFSKPIPSASSTSSADISMTEVTPSSKKRYKEAVKRALFTFRPSKKPKSISSSHVQTETKSEKMVTTKTMEETVSDSDLPIIGLKKKSNMENLPTSTSTSKIKVETSIKEKKNHEESAKQGSPN
ncbi:early nodulin-like protein 7 [Prunus dulcis]|uniref:Early nodulin-like protein 7 n=1 Tax=Prunus dulcis TaxID=3755 RepID=A0A5H2XI20_PRUDU|nr:early nodulin-like protein 7 [Prunus dulcis]